MTSNILRVKLLYKMKVLNFSHIYKNIYSLSYIQLRTFKWKGI